MRRAKVNATEAVPAGEADDPVGDEAADVGVFLVVDWCRRTADGAEERHAVGAMDALHADGGEGALAEAAIRRVTVDDGVGDHRETCRLNAAIIRANSAGLPYRGSGA